jgi:hypothetical protein
MALVFKSSTPETFKIVGVDTDGRQRVATATRSDGRRWELKLTHPSGRTWSGDFHGHNILDALGELLNSKEDEYKAAKARGHKPEPQPYDYNRRVDEGTVNSVGVAPLQAYPVDWRAPRTRR